MMLRTTTLFAFCTICLQIYPVHALQMLIVSNSKQTFGCLVDVET